MTPALVRNPHLSYSRLSRFEQCPLSYQLHYIEKKAAEPGLPLRFGKLIHAVLERLFLEVLADEQCGVLSEERAVALYQEAWMSEGVAGIEFFQEGLRILRSFIRDQGIVDHRAVLGVEKEFHLQVGPFAVVGCIDRVDRIDDESVEVIDYKTNHQLFTREEVDTSLQLSLYDVAVRDLWPWVKKVKLTFAMVRHGLRQETSRTDEQRADALAYVETLGRQTETVAEFPAKLNANCSYCDHRRHCPAYAEALAGKREFLCEDLADLESVAREREQVARLSKVLYARKQELDDILRVHLQDKEQLELGGVRYRMLTNTSLDYPLEPTLNVLSDASGLSRDALRSRLATVDKKELESMLKGLSKRLEKPKLSLLKAELEAHATKTHSPRFWAKEVA